MRRICTVIAGAALMALLLAACGSPKKSTSAPPGLSTTLLATTTTTTTITTTTALAPAGTVSDKLGKTLVVPAGFLPSTSSDVTNGPLDAAAFDKQANQPGAAAVLGFVGGYDETYDQVSGNDSVDVILLQFTTPAQATAFRAALLAHKEAGFVTSTFGAIPGAIAVNGPNSDGTYDHSIAAFKGNRLMAIDYTASTSAPVKQLVSIVVNQYRAI